MIIVVSCFWLYSKVFHFWETCRLPSFFTRHLQAPENNPGALHRLADDEHSDGPTIPIQDFPSTTDNLLFEIFRYSDPASPRIIPTGVCVLAFPGVEERWHADRSNARTHVGSARETCRTPRSPVAHIHQDEPGRSTWSTVRTMV